MSEKRAQDGSDVVKPYIPVLVAIISTFGITLGGNYLLVRDVVPEIVAPDRFTGREAAELKQDIADIRNEVIDLRLKVNDLPPRALLDRLIEVELRLDHLEGEVENNHQ